MLREARNQPRATGTDTDKKMQDSDQKSLFSAGPVVSLIFPRKMGYKDFL
jgi:hypothetical protein